MLQRKSILAALLALAAIQVMVLACGGEAATDTPAATSAPPASEGNDAATVEPATSEPSSASQSSTPASAPARRVEPGKKIRIVTTSNILADWVRAVGGDRVDVFPLLPPNADPHTYQPGAQDITRIADADVVFSVGLSLESGWLDELLESAARDREFIVAVGDSVDPIDFVEILDDHGGEESEAVGRLLVTDGETAAMSVIDLESGEVDQDAFDLGSQAGLIGATRSGRFAVAVSGDADTVHVFDGGVYLEGHGDHFDQVEEAVTRLDVDLSGDNPVHIGAGGEWATIFYGGTGEVVLINEHELEEEGSAYVPSRITVGAQDGVVVPMDGDLFAVSVQHPDYDANPEENRSPVGAEIMDFSGQVLHLYEGCQELRGAAGNGRVAAFGCMGGALVMEAHNGEYEVVFIDAPTGSPEDFKLTSVWGYPGLDHFFAQGPGVGLYAVDPEEGAMEQLIPASGAATPTTAAISHDGEALLVLMSDGELRMYDSHDLDLEASARDLPGTLPGTGSGARPQIVTAPRAVFITDPEGGEVLRLDDHDLELVDRWEIAGSPTGIAFVGLLGEIEDAREHGRGQEGEEDHGHGELDPHFWFDPLRVQQAVNSIAAQLSTTDPAGQAIYRDNAAAYNRELDELHAWITEQVSVLPEGRRVLVTSHESFQYFARRYGFEVAGAIFPVSTETEPTAQDLAKLIEIIESEGVPAVFTEKSHSERLAQRVAEEGGATVVGGLHTGSLGEVGGEAGSYIDLMRFNTTIIVEALR